MAFPPYIEDRDCPKDIERRWFLVGTIAAFGWVISAKGVAAGFPTPVSVAEFGAVGDGMHDDTAAFRGAVATGRPVVVPRPDAFYFLSAAIVDENTRGHIKIFGIGPKPRIRLFGNPHSKDRKENSFCLVSSGVKTVHLENLDIRGGAEEAEPQPVAETRGIGLNCVNCPSVIVRNVAIFNFSEYGVRVQNSGFEGAGIETARCGYQGFAITNASDFPVRISSIYTHHNGRNGLSLEWSRFPQGIKNVRIGYVWAHENKKHGIVLSMGGKNASDLKSLGVSLRDFGDVSIKSIESYRNRYNGVHVNFPSAAFGIVRSHHNGRNGFLLTNPQNLIMDGEISIKRLEAHNNGAAGFTLKGSSNAPWRVVRIDAVDADMNASGAFFLQDRGATASLLISGQDDTLPGTGAKPLPSGRRLPD